MTQFSEEAMEAALEALSKHAASGRARANWMSTYLVAARMAAAGYENTTVGANSGVDDIFVLLPGNELGRINPFVDLSSGYRWGQVEFSGRKTVWNTGTRNGQQTALFVDGHFKNGLRPDAIDVLLEHLGDQEPLPNRDALAVLVTRDEDWSSPPSRDEFHLAACKVLGLSSEDFYRITSDEELGVQLMGDPEWSPALLAASVLGPAADPLDVGDEPPTPDAPVESIQVLVEQFGQFLAHYGIAFSSREEILDLLASALSSQLLIMAGPSGSGKSLMASALAGFFAPKDARCRLESARLLAKREEFLGYFSFLADRKFVAYDSLLELLRVCERSDETPPCVTIEEANLSPIEGYLPALVHGLGGAQTEWLTVGLHTQEGEVESQVPGTSVPRELVLGPFPRFFATINVDADSPAPARKVVSRSCVVLLEAPTFAVALSAADSLVQPSVELAEGPAAALIGRPAAAFARYVKTGSELYQQALSERADVLRTFLGVDVIAPRQLLHALMYMAWYVELAGIDEPDENDAVIAAGADNALLHFVLPSLPAQQFAKSVSALAETATGILGTRLERLRTSLEGQHFGPPPDFWGALS